MLPLDPPFAKDATIGGIVAANTSGPRRRLYGTARDMVIGMTFATLEGKLVETGGMVVKNVAGLDMGKLMIGSFGTLAAIAVVNFRVHPMPAGTRTFVRRFDTAAEAAQARNAVLESVLQPMAVDLLKDEGEYALLIRAGGSKAVLERYALELPSTQVLEGVEEDWLWRQIREFTPDFLVAHEDGAVVRVSGTLQESMSVIESLPEPAVARAGSGVCYGYFAEAEAALRWLRDLRAGKAVIEYAPALFREREELWPEPGADFPLMQRIKSMLDPQALLNRGRLFGRI
jgi:glycolate oxidase FAD binding subunit